ncbi:MAG: insulinase family protein, partial [Endomicrobiaceae bacterium]|nr:insulinase family protein [Endomicrobiaceae bacterium]
ILGGNMSSRLFVKIREKLGLCYYIRCESSHYEDTGIFSITSGLDKTRIEQAIKYIFEEVKKIVSSGVTDKELKMAKEFLKGQFMLKIENSMSVIDFYLEQLLLKQKFKTPEQILKEFDRVKKEDILNAARYIFKKEKINLAVISPQGEKKYFLNLINKYY